ncbi:MULTISPECIES: cryptochrome/photolyase family protein [Dyella]|uniref:Deoxyribodipyrimidine photo-lyase n=2 Tax=Dyella TaxID=231454 RepID=A0A4R0YTT2_9GAMM|nr:MULTISPECIES: deoxyribodipyrimidine photo-lyase [Dyella]TBR39615.1 deoxyribodipyrimidine photo-lyase [Dyella terrae]TCI12803.1 deoxyribodipyrimidine photo-lyase [Dyella soli]
MSVAIVWFRRDLRLADNPALTEACKRHDQVLPVYIHAPDDEGAWKAGGASRWWLHRSLDQLGRSLAQHKAHLHVAQGTGADVLARLVKATGAEAVYWNRCYEPRAIKRDAAIKKALRGAGMVAESFSASLWREPWQVATQQGEPYRVFTPFWRNLRTQIQPDCPLSIPLMSSVKAAGDVPLETLGLMPGIRWHEGLDDTWQPGERGAHEALELFIDDALKGYERLRDLPARHGTSRLSPHLHFGEVSPRQIHWILHERTQQGIARRRPDLEPFLRELGWREFAHHLLYHFPKTPREPFQPSFTGFPWADDHDGALRRWQQGRTGIPIVDAGMRELWRTGWMHNRVRMIVASFLTKNLRLHWHHGARWFWDTLVDADLANNTLGWQWVAGSGADAAPYFRVFNPVTQAKKFDPEGEYLRRWLPELADAPLPLLHEPWKDPALLDRTGYPAPLVDLGESREAALAAYQAMRRQR